MAESKHAQFRYKIIDKYLRNKQGISYKDLLAKIQEYLFLEFGITSITKRQLEIDLNHIENYFEIEIVRENSNEDSRIKILRYKDINSSIFNKPLSEEEIITLNIHLKEMLSFQGRPNSFVIHEIIEKITKDISLNNDNFPTIFYQGNEFLKGIEYFQKLYSNISEKKNIKIQYQNFIKNNNNFTISPYFLKEYNSRWYIFGHCLQSDIHENINGKIVNLALDRIINIDTDHSLYYPLNFNPIEYFEDIYGVTQVESPIEKIILNFYGLQGYYVKTNPIHPSQKGKWIDECIYQIELNLKINYELISKLLTFGSDLIVLSPYTLKEKIIEIAKKTIKNYEK